MFVTILLHINKKELIVTNWKYILFDCVVHKQSSHVFIFSSFFVSGEGSSSDSQHCPRNYIRNFISNPKVNPLTHHLTVL